MGLLEGRVGMVTGAGRGIGRAIALALSSEGSAVIAADIRLEEVNATASQIIEKGGRAIAVEMDVTSPASIENAFHLAMQEFQTVDILVNNAGVVYLRDALTITKEEFDKTFSVNTTGTFLCSQFFAKVLKEKGSGGSIVNVASNAGKVGFPGQCDYNAAKAAVINLTRSLAMEFAPLGINVNAVCPGAVETEMLFEVAKFIVDQNRQGDPVALMRSFAPPQLSRLVQPEEVAIIVAFLASDKAAIIRGQSINLDGGATPY